MHVDILIDTYSYCIHIAVVVVIVW